MTEIAFKKAKEYKTVIANSLTLRIVFLFLLIFCFFISVEMMVASFKTLSGSAVRNFLVASNNPFIGLFAGLLITSITQSSSSTTSVVVAMVASDMISLQNAVPVIMGANIGTTVTSTIVSLGHIHRRKEFERAISAATLHDFFNIISVTVMLPLEYYFHFLSDISAFVSNLINFNENSLAWTGNFGIKSLASKILSFLQVSGFWSILISTLMLFTSLRILVFQLKSLWVKRFQEKFNEHLLGSSWKSLFSGLVLTGIIQSSSVTTSLTVPLVAAQKITLERAFPFIVGANIGTTFTALLVALSKSEQAMAIALCHLFFNIFGAFLLLPFAFIRRIPIYMSETVGRWTMRFRITGFLYILLVFFILPFLLIYGSLKSDNFSEKAGNKNEVSTNK